MSTDRLIKSSDGSIWMDVTDKSKELFFDSTLELFEYYENEDSVIRMPIKYEADLLRVLESTSKVCVFVGRLYHPSQIEEVTVESWELADKIQHNGFIYVKYSDLRFCR